MQQGKALVCCTCLNSISRCKRNAVYQFVRYAGLASSTFINQFVLQACFAISILVPAVNVICNTECLHDPPCCSPSTCLIVQLPPPNTPPLPPPATQCPQRLLMSHAWVAPCWLGGPRWYSFIRGTGQCGGGGGRGARQQLMGCLGGGPGSRADLVNA